MISAFGKLNVELLILAVSNLVEITAVALKSSVILAFFINDIVITSSLSLIILESPPGSRAPIRVSLSLIVHGELICSISDCSASGLIIDGSASLKKNLLT